MNTTTPIRYRAVAVVCLAAMTALGGGCTPSGGGGGGSGGAGAKAPPPPRSDPSLSLDPCADQLHEIAGMLLEYYVAKRELPPTLAQLKAVDPTRPGLFVCPTSGQPYVYNPKGPEVPTVGGLPVGRLVLYDAVPAHRGARWGIAVQEAGPGKPLVTRVIEVPSTVGVVVRPTTVPATKAPWE